MERQSDDARAVCVAADDQSDGRSNRGMAAVDESHGDRRADAGPEAAGCDDADRRAVRGDDLRSVAGRRAPVWPQADP